jgi:pyruvate-formate lyase-activating enzyme
MTQMEVEKGCCYETCATAPPSRGKRRRVDGIETDIKGYSKAIGYSQAIVH